MIESEDIPEAPWALELKSLRKFVMKRGETDTRVGRKPLNNIQGQTRNIKKEPKTNQCVDRAELEPGAEVKGEERTTTPI